MVVAGSSQLGVRWGALAPTPVIWKAAVAWWATSSLGKGGSGEPASGPIRFFGLSGGGIDMGGAVECAVAVLWPRLWRSPVWLVLWRMAMMWVTTHQWRLGRCGEFTGKGACSWWRSGDKGSRA